MPVVVELHEIQTLDQAGGRIARDQIDLACSQRAITESQVHHARLRGEAQAVCRGQSAIAVLTLEKLVPEAGAPARRKRAEL